MGMVARGGAICEADHDGEAARRARIDAKSIRIDEPPADNRRKANWARLIQKVYEVDSYSTVIRASATFPNA